MDILDIFLNKYSYKFPKGYPDMNNEQDVLLMEGLLSELGINEEEDKNLTFEQCKAILSKDVKLKEDIIDEIETIYDANPNNQKSFLDNFRKHSINDLDLVLDIYKNYVNIKKEGLGRGEITVLLGIKDSVSGGKNEKDIKIGNEIYDVKELTRKEFRTASSGYITNSSFQKHYVYLMFLLSLINKDNKSENIEGKKTGSKKSITTIQDKINFLIKYFNSSYKAGNMSEYVFNTIDSILPELRLYTEAEENIEEKLYIKIGDKKYEIDNVIKNADGTPESVKLGLEVKEQKSLIIKLLKHPWVKNPDMMYKDLNQIWLDYLKVVNGLIIYDKGKLTLYNNSELQKKFEPFRIVQNQLNIARKGESHSPDENEGED
jgi:hypothetical protein